MPRQLPDTSDDRSPVTVPESVNRLLEGLRSKVRRFVILQSVAVVLIWLAVTFWLALAIDYLPVSFGLDEPGIPARAVLLAVIVAGTCWLVWRYLLNRIFVSLKDSSMALLLERTFPEFGESLITSVEAAAAKEQKRSSTCDRAMLDAAVARATSVSRHIDVNKALNPRPLRRMLAVATILLATVLLFAAFKFEAFQLAAGRLYGLSTTTWPRVCNLEILGMKVKRGNPVDGIAEIEQVIAPDSSKTFYVARGSSVTLMIRAATGESVGGDGSNSLPASCILNYIDADGNRGKQALKRVGVPRDGFQLYSIDGAPLDGILNDLTLTIRGGDHRIGPFRIDVVDWPVVISTELDCEFPTYMVDYDSMRWTPRTVKWTGRSQLPRGTCVKLRSTSNKDLSTVYVVDRNQNTTRQIKVDGSRFEFDLPALNETRELDLYLVDTQGIVSEQPHSLSIEPIDDQPPVVRTALTGIGTAVTPDVEIPVSGTLTDDYGVARQWIEIDTPSSDTLVEQINDPSGLINQSVDFRRIRQQSETGLTIPTGEGNQLRIRVVAEDACDLESVDGTAATPNVGTGDEYVLDIVDSGELLKILERAEVDQRRRLEQIRSELQDARGYLTRSRSMLDTVDSGIEPGDTTPDPEPGDTDDSPEVRSEELRLLFARRTIVQIDKSADEISGVAESFDHIRLQLINNRIDSEDRKLRLRDEIVAPLNVIAAGLSGRLRTEVAELEVALNELQKLPGDPRLSSDADYRADLAIETADSFLADIDNVLAILVKYETQNELLDIVRRMIAIQEELNARTEKERKRQQFRGLLDD